MSAFLTGFSLGLSLILAIGAQNAFVLRQGLQRRHVLPVVLTCAISDAVLIVAGVSGFGALTEAAPWVADVLRWAGAAFLVVYGALAFRSAWRGTGALKAEGRVEGRASAAVVTCLALTWLNPHVYLDTVVLIGSVAAQHDGVRTEFGSGAVLASFTFFFSLGYGARLLAPVFARPLAWRMLDLGIGCIMWAIAAGLVIRG
jgi:L-lysine exporter family protein LysE/ArgO